jgi:eukaryotic-like serine/threonine-protein kinase
MRRFFRFVLMTLVLVTVAVMSGLTAMRVAIHGRETTIPGFVKLSVSQAERLAQAKGLNVSLEGQFYSADVPEGRIVSQQPRPGTRVRRGWPVRLALSLGVQRVTIPDVLGQSPRAAELNVRQRGLEIDTIAEVRIPDAPSEEEVVAQSPPPAAINVQSPQISLLVAQAPDAPAFVMPSFVGLTLAEASASIEQAGFKLGNVQTATAALAGPAPDTSGNASLATGTTVVRQIPAAGQKISSDTPITLVVNH